MKLATLRLIFIAGAMGSILAGAAFAASAPPLTIPITVKLPDLEPLVTPNADPAADHFIEIDFAHRPPPGATPVQRIGAWVTADGVFHWPFVMRIRNIGDKPFMGKPGKQFVIVTMDDLAAKATGQEVSKTPFDRVDPRSGVAARFEFTAPAADVQAAKFHRIYTLSIRYDQLDMAIAGGPFGDSNLLNNSFKIEFDGSRKGWVFEKAASK